MKRLRGFSLMEMMIVLAIVAVVAAASAPMVNKKMVRVASEKSPWIFVNGESIGYNIDNGVAYRIEKLLLSVQTAEYLVMPVIQDYTLILTLMQHHTYYLEDRELT